MRILIMGYYGFGNLGDEAILEAMLEEMRVRFPKESLVVLYPKKEKLATPFMTLPREEFLHLLKGIYQSDILLCGGGSLLQDETSKKSLLYYLGLMFLALLFGKKVLIMGQGMGPIHSSWGRYLIPRILKHLSFISLRDDTSLKYLRFLGVPEKRLHLGADLSLLLQPVSKKKAQELLKREGLPEGKKGLALAFRPWKDEEYYRLLLPFIQAYSLEEGLIPVFFPFFPQEDLPLALQLMRDLRGSILIGGDYKPQEIMGMLGEMEMVIGVRLHALIFAALNLTPFVGISYDPKVKGFLRLFGIKEVMTLEEFDGQALYEELVMTKERWSEGKDLMEKRLNALKSRVHLAWDLLEQELRS